MRPIVVLVLASTAAHAQAIFPAGGEVPPTPTIWISAAEVPAITVRDADGPVLFEVDEMKVRGSLHRIGVRPQLDIGAKFTIQAGHAKASFTVVDGQRHGIAADTPEIEVDFKRIAIEHRGHDDVLVVDALAKYGTTMYLLDQGTPIGGEAYQWIGEGHANGDLRRFEISLASFGVSCASTATVEFSPYTQQLAGDTTLYPIARLELRGGKIRLPLELVGPGEPDLADRPWLPCPGASAVAPPPAPEPAPAEPTIRTIDAAQHPDDITMNDQATMQREEPHLPPADPGSSWQAMLAALALLSGIALVMWRAASRHAA